jgi:DHA3 family macrolide efflux protein-like MFS transporter
VDRWDRRKTMIFADLFIAMCSGIMALLFWLGETSTGYIYLLLALRSIGSAFHVPAMQASTPLIAPESQLMRVAGVNQSIFSLSTIAGPAIAALFVSSLSMTHALLFDVLGAIIATISLIMVKIPNPVKKVGSEEAGAMLREFKEGFKALLHMPGLKWLFIFIVLATFFIVPVATIFPLMTLDHFNGTTYQMSLIEIVWGVGMLAGGGIMSLPKFNVNKIILINTMYIILGLTFFFSGFLSPQGFLFFAILTTIGGIAAAIFHGSFTVVMQTSIDPAVMGRAFSIFDTFTMMPAMVGLLLTGYIADTIGISNAFIISGGVIALLGAISFFVPSLMHLNKSENVAK